MWVERSAIITILTFLTAQIIQIAVREKWQVTADITRTENGFFKCPEDPITAKYPDPNDKYCLHYFLCHRAHAFPLKCPPRFAFHPDLKECLARERVPERICPFEVDCGFNGYYPDKNDCTKYFLCFYQNPTHYSCTKGNIFDATKKKCVLNKEQAFACSKPKPLPAFAAPPPAS